MLIDMKVLVTGGNGLVGSHAAAAIARGGHELRLLVRRPEQVTASLGPLGLEVTDVVVGDVLDEHVVSQAVEGCEAVVHAAAVFSLDPRRAEEMRRTNARATELVLGRAVDRGMDPVVHVSTTVALTRYAGSAPVVTIYPGGVWGPGDPYRDNESERGALDPARPLPALAAEGCTSSTCATSRR